MNTQIKDRWLEALRSGEYKKTTTVLKRFLKTVSPRYCCMGVLCNVIKDDFPHAKDLIEQNDPNAFHNANKSKFAILDQEALAFTGVNADQQRTLTSMNDKGASFERIANYIERKL